MNVDIKIGGMESTVGFSKADKVPLYWEIAKDKGRLWATTRAGSSAQSPGGGTRNSGGGTRYLRLTGVLLIQENLTN